MKTELQKATNPLNVPTGIEFDGVYLDTEKLAPTTVLTIPYGMSGKSYKTWRKKHQNILEIIHEK
jgi:hypothetical protein